MVLRWKKTGFQGAAELRQCVQVWDLRIASLLLSAMMRFCWSSRDWNSQDDD